MKKQRLIMICAVVCVLAVLSMVIGTAVFAQQGDPGGRGDVDRPTEVNASSNYIPIQGRLADSAGNPLNGSYNVTFRLYSAATSGTADCVYNKVVTVNNGLFNTYFRADNCPIDGRMLYLGIQVEDDPEMSPRMFLDNVPYAWSLRPGALISSELDDSILTAQNNGDGPAITGQSVSGSLDAVGVHGTSLGGTGVKGDALVGAGVEGNSFSGVAIKATGTGVIQSTAESYVWISGNGVRPFHQGDSTIIDMTNYGGANIRRGANTDYKVVMLPIAVPGELYGQEVTLTDLDIYWKGLTSFDAITVVLLRRQTGVCGTSECFASILTDHVDHVCWSEDHPTGCTLHYDLSTNNVLSSSSGILYLALEMGFSSDTSWIEIGGAKLTLAHE